MRIGVFENGWWQGACEAMSHEFLPLPVTPHASGNAYAADLAGRLRHGAAIVDRLRADEARVLVDNGGTGIVFATDPAGTGELKLVHELAERVLCSHFIDPLVTAFQGLDWPVVWQCLQSSLWVKAMWDRAQVNELIRFGVPNVMHLPMAAPDRDYDTRPLDPAAYATHVSFVGGQNTSFFHPGVTVPASSLLAGTLAQAIRSDMKDVSFYEMYHDIYGLGLPVTPQDDLPTQVAKSMAYFSAKLFFNAGQCIRNRDRFVIFLKRHMGDTFRLIGSGWDAAYGLTTETPFATTDAYFRHFREAAINLNLVAGNAETGLNMRHFEITAAGGFMLCYEQPELAEHFDVGKECVAFRNESELIEKIEYYLGHPEERVAIALAGQRRTLSGHLYRHRLAAVLAAIQPAQLPIAYSKRSMWEDLKAVVPDAKVVLDCGANVGQMAEAFRQFYPRAEIYSFEPVAANFEQLRKRCEPLGVHEVKKAVGDHDGKAVINLTASPEAHSLFGFQEANPCAKWTRVVGQEEVEVCTLDRWCQDNRVEPERVDVIKLDVQGSELPALRGACTLLKTAKAVYLEVAFVPIYKDAPLFDAVDRFLVDHGYHRHAVYPSDQPRNWGDALYVKS